MDVSFNMDMELLEAQIRISSREIRESINRLCRSHICFECGALAIGVFGGVPYCESCYQENIGGFVGYAQEDYEQL